MWLAGMSIQAIFDLPFFSAAADECGGISDYCQTLERADG
jgi:hypothetical protein